MLFRRRTSLSVTSPDMSWEPTSPKRRPLSPSDPQTQETIRAISTSIDQMCEKGKANPQNALTRSASALKDIFNISKNKGVKPYQVALFSDKVGIFNGVFYKVYGDDVDSEAVFARGQAHYERLASELEHISKKMSSPRNPLDLGNAIVDINAAITRVPAQLEEERRQALGKDPAP